MLWEKTPLTPVMLSHQGRGGLYGVIPTQRGPRAIETRGVRLVAVVRGGAAAAGSPRGGAVEILGEALG